MSCDVCIGGGDADGYPEFFEEAWPKARKDHRCCECRQTRHSAVIDRLKPRCESEPD
jgi:hypothetical protein